MKGRITRLVSGQQVGTIAAEDGTDYVFHSRALIDATFGSLGVGPMGSSGGRRAENVRLVSK